jgi:hypothetical protein
MEVFSNRTDVAFACTEYMWKKWLALPELADPETRLFIRDSLRHMYYDWTVARLHQLRLLGALQKMNDLKAFGEANATIAATLGARAAKKLGRIVRAR